MAKVMFKGFEIRPSGKHFFKLYKNGVATVGMRVRSIEAAQAMINSTGRVMTRKEHALVYGSDPNREPTAQQAESERRVIAGECEGFV